MHALRRYIQQELDARGWRAQDLANKSGLARQQVSKLLTDDREVLPQLPRTSTLAALARAFDVSTAHVTTVAVEALGVPGVSAPAVVHEIESVDDEVLLRELLRRAVSREQAAPASVHVLRGAQSRHRPYSRVNAELRVAEEDLADLPDVPGAESKRAEYKARVDTLKAELVASRAATGESDSVAEL